MESKELKALISKENWDSVKAAINDGYDLNSNDEYGTPIMLRFASSPLEVIQLCLDKGANLNAWIIHNFVKFENIDVIAYLIKSKININFTVETKEDFSVMTGDINEFVPFQGIPFSFDDEKHTTKFKIGKLLLKAGLDINATDSMGRSGLHTAAMDGDIKAAKFLLENGADKKMKDSDGKRAFHLAEKDQKELKALIK